MRPRQLDLYAAETIGAYGYEEKPWYLPGQRLNAFLEALEAAGLTERVQFVEADAASDDDLQLFHTAAHVASVRRRCATNSGSLDEVHPRVHRDVLQLLRAVGEDPDSAERRVQSDLAPSMSFGAYTAWLTDLGLLDEPLGLTRRGADWVRSGGGPLGGPTLARKGVERAATWMMGAVIDATRRILAGDTTMAFVPIAGFHHAHREEARMYCLYNDPATAIRLALDHQPGPVAYIDIDIHQGDGVYGAFATEPRVVLVDLHEDWSTLFPFTPEAPGPGPFPGRPEDRGLGDGRGNKHNIPLSPDTTDDELLAVWDDVEQHLRAARPAFIVFEAGVDGLGGDPMSHQRITPAAIQHIAARVRALAEDHAQGRLLVLGGGGYALQTLSEGWVAVVRGLLGE